MEVFYPTPISEAQYAFDLSVAEAVVECEDVVPEGAKCFICHDDGDLVRGCACRGHNGWVHIGCLVAHAEAVSRPPKTPSTYFSTLRRCVTCKQEHEGTVNLALARATWLRYAGDEPLSKWRLVALGNLGATLCNEGDPNLLLEAQQKCQQLVDAYTALNGTDHVATVKAEQHLANAMQRRAGRDVVSAGMDETTRTELRDEAYAMLTRVFEWKTNNLGADNYSTLATAGHLADSLCDQGRHSEAVPLIRATWEARKRLVGPTRAESLELGVMLLGVHLTLKEVEEGRSIYDELKIIVPRTLSPTHGLAKWLARAGARIEQHDMEDRRAAARAAAEAAVANLARERAAAAAEAEVLRPGQAPTRPDFADDLSAAERRRDFLAAAAEGRLQSLQARLDETRGGQVASSAVLAHL